MPPSRPPGDYWQLSRQPLTSLLFILPFLAAYECAVLNALSAEPARQGADLWMQNCLEGFGPGGGWLLPGFVLTALLGWHFIRKCPWTCHYETLMGMLAESLLFAMLLVMAGRLLHALVIVRLGGTQAISFLGAGIYEETLFRLFLLPGIYQLLRLLLVPSRPALLAAVLCSTLLFAMAHYGHVFACAEPAALAAGMWKIAADPQLRFSFVFRLLAGGTFSILFWMRGFGITVGCHLLYDLIVGVLLADVGCS